MKKIVFILIAVTMLFTSCNSYSSSSAKHDFRNIDFGMSTIELFEIEGEPDDEVTLGIAVYYYENREAFGLNNVELQYHIDENGIGWANANFQNEYADNKSYITEYNTVKKNLISAWGEPEKTTEDETEFNFRCSWDSGKKQLYLNRNSEGNVIFKVDAFSPEYLKASNERIQKGQKDRQQSETE